MTNFLKLTGSFWFNLYFLNMKFHEKIFTTIKVIQLWNFANFGTSEIIPKNLVTLRFLKVSLHELKFSCKTFKLSHYWNYMHSLNIKLQEKIFIFNKVIQVWNFINFGMPEIIPKNLVTLRFLKFLYQVLIGTYKMFQMRYWPNFYVDPTYSNAYFFKLDKQRVYLQGTVDWVG